MTFRGGKFKMQMLRVSIKAKWEKRGRLNYQFSFIDVAPHLDHTEPIWWEEREEKAVELSYKM